MKKKRTNAIFDIIKKHYTSLNRTLSNGISIPLIGAGLENLDLQDVEPIVTASLSDEYKYGIELFDTSHHAKNEKVVASSIQNLLSKQNIQHKEIHVITKVWYTHLGYERTKLSVDESLEHFSQVSDAKLYLHVLLQWPRCNDNIEWMECDYEEEQLPNYVKEVSSSSSPLFHQDAFLDSWKALEEIFLEKKIASIGVSNFNLDDLNTLLHECTILPHIVQADLQTLVEIYPLIDEYSITPMVYHVFHTFENAFYGKKKDALMELLKLTEELSIAPATALIHFFSQKGIVMAPRTNIIRHLGQNSPSAIEHLPKYTPKQLDHLHNVMNIVLDAIANDEQEKAKHAHLFHDTFHPVKVEFYNSLDIPVKLYWVFNEDTDEKEVVSARIDPYMTDKIDSHPGHTFVAYTLDDAEELCWFHVSSSRGEKIKFTVTRFIKKSEL